MPLQIPQLPSNPAEILSALQSLTASAHLKFAIAGNSFDAISFDGNEAISHCFTAKLYVLVDWGIFTGIGASWLGQPGLVTLTDVSGNERTLAGLVFAPAVGFAAVRDVPEPEPQPCGGSVFLLPSHRFNRSTFGVHVHGDPPVSAPSPAYGSRTVCI